MRQPNGRSKGRSAFPKIAQSDQTHVLPKERECLAVRGKAIFSCLAENGGRIA